jgi:hypothetical protein
MRDKHWSDEELVAKLYGVGPEDGHLDECESCARRWEAIRGRHKSLRAPAIEVPETFLAAQRRAIHVRLGEKPHAFPRLLYPVLAALLLAMFLVVKRPPPEEPSPARRIPDSQLFDDVFRIVSDTEPSSIGPIRSLFEEQK